MSKCEEVKTATKTRKLNDTKKKRRVKATNQDTEPVPTTNQKTKTLNKIRGCETAFLTINTIGVPQMYHWTANCSITVNRRFGVSLQPMHTGGGHSGGGTQREGEEGFLPNPQRLRAVCGMSK